jgi:hypothetical protein
MGHAKTTCYNYCDTPTSTVVELRVCGDSFNQAEKKYSLSAWCLVGRTNQRQLIRATRDRSATTTAKNEGDAFKAVLSGPTSQSYDLVRLLELFEGLLQKL